MLRSTLLLIFVMGASTLSFADNKLETKSSLKVYHVGDIASETAMKATLSGKTASDEWTSEYAETTNALGEIQELIETLCLEKPDLVRIYAQSLSLIVRHTEEGHKEISELLRDLGGDQHTWIQLERHTFNLEGSDESRASLAKLTESEQTRFMILDSKPHLTKAETEEWDALLDRVSEFGGIKETVLLKPGQRTAWASALLWPTTAMARVNHEKQAIDIRIDGITDDFGGVTSFSSHILSLAEGESARVVHLIDGGAAVWRVTATVVSPQQPVASNITVAPIMNVDEEEGIFELPLVMPQRFAPFMADLENAREEVRASLVLHQHQLEQNKGVVSLGVEFENLSMTHYARIEFNPMDLKLELFDSQDHAIPEGPKVRTDPVPQTQVAIIPPSSYVVFSTRDPDIGLNGEEHRLGAGGQVWNLVSGTYRLRGMIPVTFQFEKSRFDESRRGTALPPDSWPGAVDKENLAIHLSTFNIP